MFFCRFHTWTNFVPKPKLFLMFNVKLFIFCPLRYVIKYIFVISEIFLYMYIYIFNLFLQLFFGYFDTKSAIYILHPSRPIILHIFLRASDGKVLITQKKHQNGCRLFSYKRCMQLVDLMAKVVKQHRYVLLLQLMFTRVLNTPLKSVSKA